MPPPRVKNAAATRETMLASARRRFLAESYENVGLRDIAGDAGVDVALVGRYFGSKEELFKEVLRGGKGDWLEPGLDAARLPAHLAALATGEEKAAEDLERLLIILRSASSPKASEIVRAAFRKDVLDPVARLLDGPDPELRAGLALSVLIGNTIMRTIMGVDPSRRCKADAARTRLEAILGEALAPR